MKKHLASITDAAHSRYDATAEKYAESDRQDTCQFQSFGEKLKSLCIKYKPRNIIELGVGTGRYFPYTLGNGVFVGIDISSQMLRQAERRLHILKANGFKEIRLIEGDLLKARLLTEESYDLVYAIGVLGYHLPLNKSIMTIAASLLKPGGIFFVTTVQQPILMRAKNALRHALMRLGLPAGCLLSTYHCPPSAYRRLAKQGGMILMESLEFNDAILWNNLPQGGAVFHLLPIAGHD